MNQPSEREHLDNVSTRANYGEGVNGAMIRHTAKVFGRFFTGTSCLELGPADGAMTPSLLGHFEQVTAVEGSSQYAQSLAQQFPSLRVINELFEDYEPDQAFDTIVLGHVLEHVDDPVELLVRAKTWLAAGGHMVSAVPNARSIHRQMGVLMGTLETEDSMSEADFRNGHRRIFDPESFRACFTQAGMQIEYFGGYFLKPVSASQIEQGWTEPMIDAAMQIGERYPDIAADICVVATNR
jgi:2-polyprenyl-3-methyl-5-hydroxy-6-metoxy-1,4-benzoquinol methylase